MVQEEVEMLRSQEIIEKSQEATVLITQTEVGPALQKPSFTPLEEEKKEKLPETEKIEKGVFLFQEIVDKVHNSEAGMPQKPIFNVFQCTDELQTRLNIAIEVVKLEKKWVVLWK